MAEKAGAQAKALYEAGELTAAIEALTQGVKSSPSDSRLRTFLFELLCFKGDWERADRQLDVIGHQSNSAEIGVQVYKNCIRAEQARRRLVSDGLVPHFLCEPPVYVDLHLDVVNRIREGNSEAAGEVLQKAEEQRPAISGVRGEQKFEDFRDLDDSVGPVLEVFVQDKYTWVPIEQIKGLSIDAPSQLRDLLWAPASIQTADKELRAFIPALYVNSSDHPDDRVKLGRMTDWMPIGGNAYRGMGLRVFTIDGEEKSVFELRGLSFNPQDSVASSKPV
jgi:type VI secretion system protein ImpE